MPNTHNFGVVRQSTLNYWLENTQRYVVLFPNGNSDWVHGSNQADAFTPETYQIGILTDIFWKSPECSYQTAEGLEDIHVSYFCSMGDWASNITDMLLDNRYDKISYGQTDELDSVLFRYYTRILLLASEIIEDMTDLIGELKNERDKKKKRKELDTPHVNIAKMMEYINSVCKHKYEKFHVCNHHLPIYFEDSNIEAKLLAPIKIGTTINAMQKYDSIFVPELEHILGVIVKGYRKLDSLLLQSDGKPTQVLIDFSQAKGIPDIP